MRPVSGRSDQGLTRLESALATYLLIAVLAVAAVTLVRSFSAPATSSGQAVDARAVAVAQAPVSVSVAAPGTIARGPGASTKARKDRCPNLRGVQPAGFDCSLPVLVPALDLSAVRVKAPYQCADPENYRLVKGQSVQRNKKCVLKSVTAGRP